MYNQTGRALFIDKDDAIFDLYADRQSWLADMQPFFADRNDGMSNPAMSLDAYLDHRDLWKQSPHPLFDAASYSQQMPAKYRGRIPPLVYYVLTGEGDPGPLFQNRRYFRAHPDRKNFIQRQGNRVAAPALLDFLKHGGTVNSALPYSGPSESLRQNSGGLKLVQMTPENTKNPYYTELRQAFLAAGWTMPAIGSTDDAVPLCRRERGAILWFHQFDPFYRRAGNSHDTAGLRRALSRRLRGLKSLGARIVHTWHNELPHDRSFIDHDVVLYFLFNEFLDCVFVHTPAMAEWARQFVHRAPVHVVPHHSIGRHFGGRIARSEARQRLGLSEDSFIALSFGEFKAYKNIEELAQGWALFRKAQPDRRALLLLAGAWRGVRQLPESVTALPDTRIDNRWLPTETLQDYIAAADVCVFTSNLPSVSGAVMTALSLGRPVIIPSGSGAATMLAEDEHGFFYTPGDISSLAETLAAMAATPFRQHFGYMASALAEELHPYRVQAQYAAILTDLFGNKT